MQTSELLAQVYLGNTLQSWLLSLAAFLVTFTVLPLLRSFVMSQRNRIESLEPPVGVELALVLIARRSGNGVCTIGSCTTKPGIVTSVVEECRITLDQRHLDPAALARMHAEARAASERFAKEGNVSAAWERLWHIDPRPFHPELIELCDAAIKETCGKSHRLPSGPLHDAAEMCGAGVPTVMLFVQSLHGISHNKIEDTKEEHLALCVQAFDRLADKTMAWVAARKGA